MNATHIARVSGLERFEEIPVAYIRRHDFPRFHIVVTTAGRELVVHEHDLRNLPKPPPTHGHQQPLQP